MTDRRRNSRAHPAKWQGKGFWLGSSARASGTRTPCRDGTYGTSHGDADGCWRRIQPRKRGTEKGALRVEQEVLTGSEEERSWNIK